MTLVWLRALLLPLPVLPLQSSLGSSRRSLFQRVVARMEQWMIRFIRTHGFLGILALASYPNAAFDLCGLCCGTFMFPFWQFFGATLIGKGLFKTTGQVGGGMGVGGSDVRRSTPPHECADHHPSVAMYAIGMYSLGVPGSQDLIACPAVPSPLHCPPLSLCTCPSLPPDALLRGRVPQAQPRGHPAVAGGGAARLAAAAGRAAGALPRARGAPVHQQEHSEVPGQGAVCGVRAGSYWPWGLGEVRLGNLGRLLCPLLGLGLQDRDRRGGGAPCRPATTHNASCCWLTSCARDPGWPNVRC